MVTRPTRDELLRLSAADRLQLVEEIWQTLSSEDVPLTDAQRDELDVRLEAYTADPSAGSSWEDVRSRLRGIGSDSPCHLS